MSASGNLSYTNPLTWLKNHGGYKVHKDFETCCGFGGFCREVILCVDLTRKQF